MNNKRTALYRHFDSFGNLLYVGISLNPTGRLAQHNTFSKWTNDAVRMEAQWFDSRQEAARAEEEAIKAENPRFNIIIPNTTIKPKKNIGEKINARCTERINFMCSPYFKAKLFRGAAQLDISATYLIHEAVREYLRENLGAKSTAFL